jgi:glycosyltransferase involved in cell wall biosynthesis
MKILLIHNYYQLSGGEDEVFQREKRLLVRAGFQVVEYVRDNKEIRDYNPLQTISLAARTTWAWDSHRDLGELLKRERPDIAHFHNTFPLVSPSAYYACASAGVPVIQTLHNPRLMCPAATLYRDGKPCEDCVGLAFPWPAVQHACYQGSSVKSAVVASMLWTHRVAGTWKAKVARYIVSTKFYQSKFAAAGLPREKIALKPHFVEEDPGVRDRPGDYALFIGRLAPEKGVLTLLKAWDRLKHVPLHVRGDGPLADDVQRAANTEGSPITIVPRLSSEGLFQLIKGARFLVWPSEGLYETFGLVAIEAFACGVPVISSRSGAMQEVVNEGRSGLHFQPGDPDDLADKVNWAWTHPAELERMGREARLEFETKYTCAKNVEMLSEIYQQALDERPSLQADLSRPMPYSEKNAAN